MLEQRNSLRKIALCFLAFAVLCEVLVSLSYERGVLAVQHYVAPVCFAFLGMTLLSGRIRLTLDEGLSLCFPLWYLLSRLLLRELYLNDSFYSFTSLCLGYAMAFPFARWISDGERKWGLRIAAALYGGAYAVMAWLGVFAAVSERPVRLPFLGTTLEMEGMRLCMSTHPNVTACIFLAAFVLLLWLMLNERCRWTRALCVTGLVGLYLAIGLTDSRTVMIQVACAIAALVLFGCQKLPIRHKTLKKLAPVLIAVIVLAAAYLSFDAAMSGLTQMNLLFSAKAETIVKARDLIGDDLLTMNLRTPIYRAVFELVRDYPDVLVRGVRESEGPTLLYQYSSLHNTHNAWLQALLNMGLPGLLITLWFTVRAVTVLMQAVFGEDHHCSMADKFLFAAPAVLLINAIPESYVFTELKPDYNFTFFLFLGYAIEARRRLRSEKVKV